jgi:hypothetical protein
MRLSIDIDAVHHEIDSTDPETLGRWIVEIFARVEYPNAATWYQVHALPSFTGNNKPDWIADTRYFHLGEAKTPRELITLLTEWLDDYEANKAAENARG